MSSPRALPAPARALVAAVVIGGLAAVAWRIPEVRAWGVADLAAAIVLTMAVVAADQFTIGLRHGREIEYFSLTDAVWVAGLLLVSDAVLVAAVAAGTLIGQSVRGWEPHKVAFNVGQVVLAITAAVAVFDALGAGPPTEAQAWGAAAVAMATCFTVNAGTVALVIALMRQQSFLSVFLAPLRLNVLHWLGNVAIGILAAVVFEANPAAVILLALPLGLLYFAYRGWLDTMRQRDQMTALAMTADTLAHAQDLTRRLPVEGPNDEVAVLAQTLNRMLDRVQSSRELERRFISEASHELRTPITIIRGYLEVLGSDPTPDQIQHAIEVVLDELDRMARLVEDLTTLARAEHPSFLRKESVELAPFVGEVAVKAVPLLNGRLVTDCPADGAVLTADPHRLTQALLNLLHNASLHTRPGTPVELRVVEEPTAWRFEVVDRGGGLAPDDQELVFRPFHRSGSERSGSGLGLAIVRRIAELHGGGAGLDNRHGEGASFWLSMPR